MFSSGLSLALIQEQILNGENTAFYVETAAPARADTISTPTVRKKVLFPALFDPVIIATRTLQGS